MLILMLIFMLNAYRFISSLYPKLININAVNQIISFFQSFWYSKHGYSITANTETNSNKKTHPRMCNKKHILSS